MSDPRIVRFLDPHPGLAGCTVRLPAAVKLAADALDGRTLPLSQGVIALAKSAEGLPGDWTFDVKDDCVLMFEGRTSDQDAVRAGRQPQGPVNCWRVIRFEFKVKE